MHSNRALESLTALGWTTLAIICTYILGNIDLRRPDSDYGYDAFEKVWVWVLIGKLILLVCLIHVAVHTYSTIARSVDRVRLWYRTKRTAPTNS